MKYRYLGEGGKGMWGNNYIFSSIKLKIERNLSFVSFDKEISFLFMNISCNAVLNFDLLYCFSWGKRDWIMFIFSESVKRDSITQFHKSELISANVKILSLSSILISWIYLFCSFLP